jgi:hypothetical protein
MDRVGVLLKTHHTLSKSPQTPSLLNLNIIDDPPAPDPEQSAGGLHLIERKTELIAVKPRTLLSKPHSGIVLMTSAVSAKPR